MAKGILVLRSVNTAKGLLVICTAVLLVLVIMGLPTVLGLKLLTTDSGKRENCCAYALAARQDIPKVYPRSPRHRPDWIHAGLEPLAWYSKLAAARQSAALGLGAQKAVGACTTRPRMSRKCSILMQTKCGREHVGYTLGKLININERHFQFHNKK